MLMGQETIRYKTYVKTALVEGLRPVFEDHVDEILQRTKVDIEFPTDQADYPAVVIRFFERSLTNLGVGHREWFPELDEDGEETGRFIKYKHYYFTGDIEFAIYALSSVDRDLVGDSIVQTLTMGDLTAYTNQFFQRIYEPDVNLDPASLDTYINLNTDDVQGFGESQVIAPWMPEDVLVYQTSYRLGITGEFYSLTPPTQGTFGVVERVDQYPYLEDLEPAPPGIQTTPSFTDSFTSDLSAQYLEPLGDHTFSAGAFDLDTAGYDFKLNRTYAGDFQIDTHFRWTSGQEMGLEFYLHDGRATRAATTNKANQYGTLVLSTTEAYYEPQTFVPDREPEELVVPVGRLFVDDPAVLDDVDLWFRLKCEGFKFTGELWLADPNVSANTNRILRTAYVLDPDERENQGEHLWVKWYGDAGDTILDWTVTTPDTTPWQGETSLVD